MKPINEKPKKKRATKYETKLQLNGTFIQAIKELVEKPKVECKKEI